MHFMYLSSGARHDNLRLPHSRLTLYAFMCCNHSSLTATCSCRNGQSQRAPPCAGTKSPTPRNPYLALGLARKSNRSPRPNNTFCHFGSNPNPRSHPPAPVLTITPHPPFAVLIFPSPNPQRQER